MSDIETVIDVEEANSAAEKEKPVRVRFWTRWSDAEFAYALCLLFFGVLLAGILRHEMWRDETQGWLLARDAGSLSNLLSLTRREGHPALWHLLLYGLARVTREPVAMQFLQLFIASGSVYLMARFAPFSRLQKFLLAFGYFPLFEYGVFTRSYALGVLFLFGFCACYSNRRRNFLWPALCLLLLANTSALGLMIALALGIFLVWELLVPRSRNGVLPSADRSTRAWKLVITSSVLLVIGGAVLALGQIFAPSQWIAARQIFSQFHIAFLTIPVLAIWKSYVPLPAMNDLHFWGSNWLLQHPGQFMRGQFAPLDWLVCFLTISLIIWCVFVLRRAPRVLVAYTLATSGIFFLLLLSRGTIITPRHIGHLFLILVACLWLAEYSHKANAASLDANRIWTGILAIHCLTGIYVWGMDIIFPFSGSRATADYIHSQGLHKTIVAGAKASAVSPLSAYLDKQIVYLDVNRTGSYIAYHRRATWNARDRRRVLRHLEQLASRRGRENDILVVLNRPLQRVKGNSWEDVTPMWSSPASIVADEQYFLYVIPRAQTSSTAPR